MTTVRAFCAFEIPENVVGVIVNDRRSLEKRLPRARWVRPGNMHLTLLFLQAVSLPDLGLLSRKIALDLDGAPPPRISLGGSGFFPNERRARVAWIGGEALGAATVLEVVDSAARSLGLGGVPKSWSLHLTQARQKRPWPSASAGVFSRWADSLDLEAFEAREVVVFISDLRPDGPVYTVFERIRLA